MNQLERPIEIGIALVASRKIKEEKEIMWGLKHIPSIIMLFT